MTKKIFWSISFVAITVLSACFLLTIGALYPYFGGMQEKQLKTELALAADAVEASGVAYLEKIDADGCRFTYVSQNGSVLYDSRGNAEEMENHAGRKEIREAMETGEGEGSRYSSTLTEETLYYARRLSDGTVLRISVSRMTVLALLFGMARPVFLTLMAALMLSFLLASRMSKRILAPLNALNLDAPLENDAYDELSPMLSRMEQQLRQIRQQESELADRKREFYAVIKNMGEGLVLLNQHGIILSINPAAALFFQADTDSVGKDFLAIERDHEISKALQIAETDGHSELVISRNGMEYQMNMSRIEADTQTSGMVILIFDITEKVFAERNRREFTANVSHELKTPLHSIMGSAELIENGLVKEEDMPRFMKHIRLESARLLALLEDIIRLSQLDEKMELPLEPVNLYDMAEDVADSLASVARHRHIMMFVRGEKVVVQGVKQLVHEIIYNLCDNAIKYNVENGSVTVRISQNKDSVVLSVADTGIGIPAEHQSRVFERFYRVDKSHSKESGGTGLGLSIVKHAVQYMHGTVSLSSTPGEGTTVTVFF